MNVKTQQMDGPTWGLLLILSILWGGSFYFAKIAVGEIPPMTMTFSRVVLAGAILGGISLWRGGNVVPSLPMFGGFFVLGVIGNALPMSIMFWGQKANGAGLASILNASAPIFTVFAAHYFTHDEKMTFPKVIGILIGFAGVITLIGPSVFKADHAILPEIAGLAAAALYGFTSIFGRRFTKWGAPAAQMAAGQLAFAGLALLPFVLFFDRPWELPTPHAPAILSMLCLTILSTAIAYLLFFRILVRAGATNVMLVTLLVPVTAVLLGVLLLGEKLELRSLGGMVLIGFGLMAIDGRVLKSLNQRFRQSA